MVGARTSLRFIFQMAHQNVRCEPRYTNTHLGTNYRAVQLSGFMFQSANCVVPVDEDFS